MAGVAIHETGNEIELKILRNHNDDQMIGNYYNKSAQSGNREKKNPTHMQCGHTHRYLGKKNRNKRDEKCNSSKSPKSQNKCKIH